MQDRLALEKEISNFKKETIEITKVGEQLREKSEEIAILHEEVVNERLASQKVLFPSSFSNS